MTGHYQPQPATGSGSTAASTLLPQVFFAVDFGVWTNQTDPMAVSPPQTVDHGRRLMGNVRTVSVARNGQVLNQGSPKPGGGTPTGTTPLQGTYDPSAHAYSLTWSSRIESGPSSNFVGIGHFRGNSGRRNNSSHSHSKGR